MKKLLMIISLVSVFYVSQAQYKTDAFNLSIGTSVFEGNVIASGLTGGSSVFLPPIVVNGQTALFPSGSYWTKLISIGGSVMYDMDIYKWSFWNVDYVNKDTYIKIGGVGSYHVTPILQDYANWGEGFDKIDIYLSIFTGVSIHPYTDYEYNPVTMTYDEKHNTNVGGYFGEVLGAKYYFSDNFGIYGEVGFGGNPGYLTFGVTMDF